MFSLLSIAHDLDKHQPDVEVSGEGQLVCPGEGWKTSREPYEKIRSSKELQQSSISFPNNQFDYQFFCILIEANSGGEAVRYYSEQTRQIIAIYMAPKYVFSFALINEQYVIPPVQVCTEFRSSFETRLSLLHCQQGGFWRPHLYYNWTMLWFEMSARISSSIIICKYENHSVTLWQQVVSQCNVCLKHKWTIYNKAQN